MSCLFYSTKATVVDRAEKLRERMLSSKFKEMEETRDFKVMD